MIDQLDPISRSNLMRRVKGKNTRPELAVRRLAHSMGYRFRLHRADLPGRPDLVFPSRKKIVFVHGCFWHRHPSCRRASTPEARSSFWQAKFDRNVERDSRNQQQLRETGWNILVVWECEIRDLNILARRLQNFLEA